MDSARAIRSRHQPLGTDGDSRRRLLFHHAPLTVASALIIAMLMGFPVFDPHAYPHPDITSGTFPQHRQEEGTIDRAGHRMRQADRAENTGEGMRHVSRSHSGGGGQHGASRSHEAPTMDRDPGTHAAARVARDLQGDSALASNIQRLTMATGYIGLGLLALTLILGPANLVLRRRNPLSSYLRRDVGIWTAIFSVAHVVCAVSAHVSHGSGVITSVVHFFVAEDGRALTNSFGLGNWTGLVGTVIALVLLATSSDIALRTLKARPWKQLQRLNYALFVLVVLHAFFYGALLRMTSPYTVLLVLSVVLVCTGQAIGLLLRWKSFITRGAEA